MSFDSMVRSIAGRFSLREPQADSLGKLAAALEAVNATLGVLATRFALSDSRWRQPPMIRNSFTGTWRIVWMSAWDQDYVDMDGPGHITFGAGRSGSFQFGMVQGQMDCRPAEPQGDRVEFTWHGFDEGTEHTGRGHARIVAGELQGHLYFHLGDDSAFRAVHQPRSARQRKTAR